MSERARPMSPHLQVYRWRVTMLLSTLHRLTGLLLSLGAVVLAVWLIGLASGPAVYADVQGVLGSDWFKIPLIGWTFCFFLHLFNGVRHLVWDTGAGFGLTAMSASGWTVLAAAIVSTAGFAVFGIL